MIFLFTVCDDYDERQYSYTLFKDFLTLHIRSAGNWTNKLHNYFKSEIENNEDGAKRPVSIFKRYAYL